MQNLLHLAGIVKVVGHLGYAPSVSPSQAARIAIFLVPEVKVAACAGIAPATFRSTAGCSS